jgi:8-oxo-dGTP pyrophosphatase MutT (NUDIX family)
MTMAEYHVVTAFLKHDDRILILKRSENVSSFRSLWGGISGFIEGDERPVDRAFAEIREETGIGKKDLELVKEGRPFPVVHGKITWIVHPFLFSSKTADVKLDREHTDKEWIYPEDLDKYTTVTDLGKSLERVIS